MVRMLAALLSECVATDLEEIYNSNNTTIFRDRSKRSVDEHLLRRSLTRQCLFNKVIFRLTLWE